MDEMQSLARPLRQPISMPSSNPNLGPGPGRGLLQPQHALQVERLKDPGAPQSEGRGPTPHQRAAPAHEPAPSEPDAPEQQLQPGQPHGHPQHYGLWWRPWAAQAHGRRWQERVQLLPGLRPRPRRSFPRSRHGIRRTDVRRQGEQEQQLAHDFGGRQDGEG